MFYVMQSDGGSGGGKRGMGNRANNLSTSSPSL